MKKYWPYIEVGLLSALIIGFTYMWLNPVVKISYCESVPGNGNVLHQYELNEAYDMGLDKIVSWGGRGLD